jgi:hypothetical protein
MSFTQHRPAAPPSCGPAALPPSLDDNYIVYTVVLAQLGTTEPLLALAPAELKRAMELFEAQDGERDLLSVAVARSVSALLDDAGRHGLEGT